MARRTRRTNPNLPFGFYGLAHRCRVEFRSSRASVRQRPPWQRSAWAGAAYAVIGLQIFLAGNPAQGLMRNAPM